MVCAVQKPAPAFAATAVVDGQFKDVALKDYLGKWCAPHGPLPLFEILMPTRSQGHSSLLPNGLHIRVPYRDPRIQRRAAAVRGAQYGRPGRIDRLALLASCVGGISSKAGRSRP
jgi:hypothetical protein